VSLRGVKDAWVRGLASFASPGAPDEGLAKGRHLQSGGIVVVQSKRVTIADTTLALPEDRGGGGNGYLFEVSQSSEVLVRDCVGDAGRHNFIQNWGFGATGIVWLRIHSLNGEAVAVKDLDFGLTGLSEFHHSLATANLIDQSTVDDGWGAVNRNAESSGSGHSSTQSAVWNPDGSGVVRSRQFGHGYVIGPGPFLKIETALGTPDAKGTAPEDFVEHGAEGRARAAHSGLAVRGPAGAAARGLGQCRRDMSSATGLDVSDADRRFDRGRAARARGRRGCACRCCAISCWWGCWRSRRWWRRASWGCACCCACRCCGAASCSAWGAGRRLRGLRAAALVRAGVAAAVRGDGGAVFGVVAAGSQQRAGAGDAGAHARGAAVVVCAGDESVSPVPGGAGGVPGEPGRAPGAAAGWLATWWLVWLASALWLCLELALVRGSEVARWYLSDEVGVVLVLGLATQGVLARPLLLAVVVAIQRAQRRQRARVLPTSE
jgi:hypothetical protein